MTEKKTDQNIDKKKSDDKEQEKGIDNKKETFENKTEPETSGKMKGDKNRDKPDNDENMTIKESKQIIDDAAGVNGDSKDKSADKQEKQTCKKNDEKEFSEDVRDEKILELQAKFDDLNDRYLRLFSEFDNFRKRTIKEKTELIKTASEDIIKSLLPVIDDLDRALELINEDSDQEATREGIELILNKLKTILCQKGMEEIKAIGEEFNTDIHEAVSNVTAEKDEDKGKIVEVVQKGYLLNGKVLRYAKVVVAC